MTREAYYYIPNSLYMILFEKIIDYPQLKLKYKRNEVTISEYIAFLDSNELLLWDNNINILALFKHFDFNYLCPSKIENVIVSEGDNIDNLRNVLSQLLSLDVQNLEIRLKNTNTIYLIEDILMHSKVINLEIIIDNEKFFKEIQTCFWDMNPRIRKVTIFNSEKFSIQKSSNTGCQIITFPDLLTNESCGCINPFYFYVNIPHFTESQLHNTCLNRKICIDSDGYIKNCPSMKHHYGHISDTTLAEAIEKPGFKDCWSIKKDDIDVCQDCEFRHICTDCRAFIKDPNNIYSQPAKCGYNPYIAKWQREDGWISVEQWREENPGWEEQAIEIRELNKKYMSNN